MIKELICPDCGGRIADKGLICKGCRRNFKLVQGIPILLPNDISAFKRTEINFYEKEFEKQKRSFRFVEMYWDKNFFGLLDFMEVFKKLPKDSKILELGSGNGQYGLILRKRGFKNVFISDISLKGLVAAKRYSKEKGIHFFVLDAENLPFESDSFDAIFIVASLHHLQNPQRCIDEMKRCVKRGGLIIVALEPNSWYYYVIRPAAKLLGIRRINKSKDSFSIGDELTHGFSIGTLEGYFKKQGIKIIKKQRVWYLTAITYHFLDVLKRLFCRKILTEPKIKEPWIAQITLKIDKVIEKIPLIKRFSFHNTVVGVKI